MPIAIAEHHEMLRQSARRWLESYCPRDVPRAVLDDEHQTLPPFWKGLSEQGWLGLHIDEEHGGEGGGLLELAVIVEEMGRAIAPGPFLTTVLASALVERSGDERALKALLPGLIDGTTPASVVLPGSGELEIVGREDGALVVSGRLPAVLVADIASLVVAPAREPGGATTWLVLETGASGVGAPGVIVEGRRSLDLVRRVASVQVDRASVPAEHVLGDVDDATVRRLMLVLVAAEASGGARWCLEVATQHAKDRWQFGRPIGQFQAVKHRLADMLVSVEQVTALAWDAARALEGEQADMAAILAGAYVLDAYAECAKWCIQILGGMGFTWEHDAHLHMRRAIGMRQLCGGSGLFRGQAARGALGGGRRVLELELPPGGESVRDEIRRVVADVAETDDPAERRRRFVRHGLISPHWPSPYGRDAGPVEQLVIDEELAAAHLRRPHLAVGAWALPTIIAHGTPEQQERWVAPTLAGEMWWCQLFSEPGAGSDLASLQMRADRVEGGFVLNGQKVWTSTAQKADWGICLARTDPDAPKHAGITYFLVGIRSEGIEIRPLREITGEALFNEVFFTDVFVPDECVVGQVNDGWRLARTTLANERVSMSSGATFGFGIEMILGYISHRDELSDDDVTLDAIGRLLAEAQSIALLGERTTLRSVSGVDPGPEASVRKLLGAEHEQRVQELGLVLLGAEGATVENDAQIWSRGFLSTRCLTIAGGTSEVQRNVIGERLLGLPRDPEPGS
jgi:alkylation response protein AidB-like acyl-CoA dehydrogenase